MKTMEKVSKISPIDMLAQVLEIPLYELTKMASTLFGVLGVDSLTATRVRGMLQPMPTYQELYGLTVGQVIERMRVSFDEAASDAAVRHRGREVSDEMALLTPMQESYILGAEQDCSCQVYSEFDVENLDVDAFKRAVTSVIDDEPMLHAVIVNGNQQKLVDRHAKRHEFSLPIDNVTDLELRRSECINAVKYTDEVFWGIQLTQISAKATRIHIMLDMLFIDATSAMILCQRVIERYNASIGGVEFIATELPPLRFFDYCNAGANGDISQDALAYWEEKVKTIPGPPQIPRIKYEVSHKAKFERCAATLDADKWEKIKGIASHLQITPNSILLSAFAEVLRLYSENPEFTITVTMSERPVAINNDYSGVVGEFTNVLLCPVLSAAGKGIVEQATSFHHTLSAGLEHSDINGLDVIRMLRKHHNDPHLTFPVVFTSFIGIIKPGLALTGCNTRLHYQQTQTPQISLDHQVYEADNGLQINWDYDGRVHQGEQIAEMLRCFHCVLENVALNRPQFVVLPPELMQLREKMNDTDCEFDELENGLLHQPVMNAAKAFPDNIAVIAQTVTLTYRSLLFVANAIAVKLQDIGIGPGHSVAVVLEKGWEQVAGTLGILMTGACYLPLNPSNPDDRLRSIMKLAGCRVALVHDKTLSAEREWYVGDDEQSVTTINVNVDLAQEVGNREAAPVAIDPRSLAYIIFTSGSTGVPKGVEIAHHAALNTCLDINQRFGLGQETVTFGISSLSFDLSVWDIFGTLAAGGTLVVCNPDGTRDPDYWWQQIQQHHVTVWNTVPTSFEMLIAASLPDYVMPLKRVMLSGDAIGMAMADHAMARYPELQIIALGGATEASIWSNYHIVTADSHLLGTELVPYGRPLSNQTMHVLDANKQYRPTGVVGDIYIGGKGVAEGYFRDPTLTGEKFIHTERYGRLYETGDLGRYLPNGEIEIVGRKDSQVKVGGHRVELAEIESCAQQLSEVQRAVAVHIPGAGARVVGFVTANADEAKEGLEEKLRIHVEQLLPDYMAPQVWIVLEAIPLTANNKVDMKKLRSIAQTQPADGEESDVGAETSSEAALVLQLAAQVLDVPVDSLSASRSLIEQGLTSLYAVQLINMLKKAWNTPLSYTLIFNYPSAVKLAVFHRGQQGNPYHAAPEATRPATNYHSEPIAIIARACRLPGNVGSPDEFWHMMSSATDCMSDIPATRFDISSIYNTNPDALGATYTRRGAFIERAESFDYVWFDLPQAEARTMDPQQRMMLEVAYEACLAAGYDKEKLSGSSTGVLIGQMNYDWMMDFGHTKEYAGTGAAPSITSNRISYLLDLVGPSMTIDSACSSSLVAVDAAVAKLRSGACRMAIAGGVNLILSPEPYVFTCQAKMLSVDGRCATFDAEANGIARGEGVGAVVLKRLCDAEADGDPILGVIKGCAVNQDGRSASLTAPNGLAQEAVIRQALQEAGWQGADLDYVECHGTGTPLGDPIEIEALKNVLAVDRKKPVVLGSVKTNIGHLEGAAGITGLIKALEVLLHREAPANLHFQTLNPKIDLSGFAAVIPVKPTRIGSHEREEAVRVGVSSFGYGGTNAHVVLESYDRPSGKARARQDAWLFTGQGALQSGAAAALHAANPVFRDALERYTGQLTAWVDAPLLQWLLEASSEHSACLQETQYQQPALVALQLAQAAMWQARGLAPSHVLGHSIGEFAAAVVAGVMAIDDALMLAARRGQLMADCEPGGMAAIRDSAENVRRALPADVVIAAVNGEGMTVVAGPHDALAAFVQQHYAHEHTVLAVSRAFHSPMMASAALAFGEVVGAVPLRAQAEGVRFISTLTGEAAAETLQTAAYWSEQITQPVRFLQAVQTLLGQGGTMDGVFEIGPGATLINMAKRIAPNVRTQWIASADTLRGTPALNPFIYVPLQWKKPVPKQAFRRSASAEPAVSAADMLYQTQWMPAEPLAEVNGSGPYLLLSRHKVPVALPKDWISMVANDPADIAAALTEKDWNTVALFSEGDEEDVVQALNVLKSGMTARLVLLKRADSEGDAGLWGLARTARLEQQALRLSCLALYRGQLMQALSLCVCEDMEDECRLSDMGELQVPRLQRYQPPSGEGNGIRAGATYLISGGNGALGQLAAQYLAEQGATHLVLLSRSGQPMAPVPQWGKSIQLASLACDVAEANQVKAVLRQLAVWGWPDIAGVIHTAGVLTDGVLVNQSAEMFMQAQAAKVLGARLLHDILSPTDFIVLYSSVAATLGSVGQVSYAAANSTLDALAERWAQAGECALSIQWGAWSDVGMAVRSHAVSRIEQSGYGLLDNESGISLLARLLQSRSSGVICASPIVWRKLSHFSPRFSSFMATPSASSADAQAEWSADDVRRLVRESIEPFMSEKHFDEDLPFMEAGLSSLDLVQIRQALLKSLPTSLELPTHFVFNYPTARDVGLHLIEQLGVKASSVSTAVWQRLNDKTDGEPLFLIGGVMGNAEKTFGTLAQALSVPVYAAIPAIPADPLAQQVTLESVATALREAMLREVPSPSYSIGGLSFGAALALEVGLHLEAQQRLSRVIMFDPRHLAPFIAPPKPAPFETLLENYVAPRQLFAPVLLFQSTIPPIDTQSEMMREASRSFQNDADVIKRCHELASTLEVIPCDGHHFNLLYKHYQPLVRKIEEEMIPSVPERGDGEEEAIAIIGTSCRLPGNVSSPEDFWQMMLAGTDCVGNIPAARFDIDEVYDPNRDAAGCSYTRQGAFISHAEDFDYAFFGISLAEAKVMDPQQRLLLEVAYDAFHSAGLNKASLKGSSTSVHIGLANDDWSSMGRDEEAHNPYFGAGVSGSISSNRISYLLGLTGPSVTIDTACSSSLVAVDLAVDKLRQGICSMALVGGVNVMLHHRMFVSACATKALSSQGRCATFDEAADGYCRGEGAGAVVLKRLSDAEADGDAILAVIRGTAVNQDGRSVSMTAPNGLAQEAVITLALAEAGLRGQDVDYIECHGTGTPLGDPIEVGALKNVLGRHRSKPVVLGAVKTNIGHLEGAAGVIGLIKAVEVLRRRQAPGNVHFRTLNPNIDLSGFDAIISAKPVPLGGKGPLVAGVSSFGFGGTNAHVVLESYERPSGDTYPRARYTPHFLPWRRLPNPLLSRSDAGGFAATLNDELAALWRDHRIGGQVLVPAASHITMIAGAALLQYRGTLPATGVEVRDITMTQPLVVREGDVVRCLADGDQWVIENGGGEQYAGSRRSQVLTEGDGGYSPPDVTAFRLRSAAADIDALYDTLAQHGVGFGDGYRNLHDLYLNEHEALARVAVTLASPGERALSLLHPATLDAGIQLLGLCGMKSCGVCIPFSVSSARLFALESQPTTLWASAQIDAVSAKSVAGTIMLFGDGGELYAVLEGVSCRQAGVESRLNECLFEAEWVGVAAPEAASPAAGMHLLLSRRAVGTPLPEGWRGMTVGGTASLAAALSELPWQTVALLSEGEEEDMVLALTMLQAETTARRVLLKRADREGDAGLSGLARTARLEQPERALTYMELAAEQLPRALALCAAGGLEDVMRIDGTGQLQVQRLQRCHLPAGELAGIRAGATYVISGGNGALGQVAAGYLAQQGATHLLLLSRSGRAAALPEWEGVQVQSLACDVADAADVTAAGDWLVSQAWPAVAGVIHTAGILTDGTLANQSAEKLTQAWAVKVRGAEYLHDSLAPSDFMVLYSSAAATFGSAGQASYAAANAGLDALAQRWSQAGERVLSVQWGAWSEDGMAVRHDAVRRAEAAGFGVIDNALGRAVLERLLASGQAGTLCVSPIDWARTVLDMPLVSRFKLQRRERAAAERTAIRPAQDLLALVRRAAAEAVGKPVADDEPLMASGLDSLNAVILSQTLSKALGVSLGSVFALNHPSIAEMAEALVAQVAAGDDDGKPSQAPLPATAVRQRTEEPIAIIGSACRLPGDVYSPEDFWQMLLAGTDCVSDIPASRFDIDGVYDPDPNAVGRSYTRRGAFMGEVESFDYEFFSVPLAEARVMDPQQRLLLEVAYEAFYHSGYDLDKLRSQSIGVFVGQMNHDWAHMHGDNFLTDPYFGAGSSSSITSNRMSYLLGLTGPSMTLDTACSSSLVAVDLAVEKLRSGVCSAALVGGVNVMLSHRSFVGCSASKMLSQQGRCATFDEAADGYCRGEGVGAVVLKRLSDAEADGDTILAVIRGTAVNQDGRSASLTAPNGGAQEAVIEQALKDAGLRGQDVDYIECHGTGTPLGDPIEVGALKNVLGRHRSKPVVLGAVKTNIGHLEGAAGVIGLIKAVEVLRHRQAPGNVHFRTLNPKIDLNGFDAIIPTAPLSLGGNGPLIAGVSSFGFGGTNAHVVLESYDRPSGKTRARQDAWLFTGQGALQSGAAAALHAANPVFRDALEGYAAQLAAWVDAPLLQWLLEANPEYSARLQETQYQQPALVALQLAQVAMWQARGLVPSQVLGHSIGEFAAAVVAGVMAIDDALMLAARRGQLMADCEPGGMAAIRDSAENVRRALPADVVIAAENGESMTVVAGPHVALAGFVQQHYAHEHTLLAVSHAFHSPMMASAALAFGDVVGTVALRAPEEVRFISTLTGEAAGEALQMTEYWSEQITQPVRFLQAVQTLLRQGGAPDGVFEIGPGATLINMAKRIAPDVRTQWVTSKDESYFN